MGEHQLLFEKVEKITQDEDFAALTKKLLSDDEIHKIMLELGLKLEAIYRKLRDAYLKILIDELYNEIKHKKDFKELLTKHGVKNKNQFIFDSFLYSSVKRFICQNKTEE